MKKKDKQMLNIRNKAKVKTIIKKTKKRVAVTEQLESESKGKNTFISFSRERKPVISEDSKVVVEDLFHDTQERNDIHNGDQNNINKDDEFFRRKH